MKKKEFFWSLLAMLMVATLSVGFSSCGKDDDDPVNNTFDNSGDNGGGSNNGGDNSGDNSGGSNNDETVGSAVDLGLSVLFADRNIGAKAIEDLGALYAWAETETKTEFSIENYFDRNFTVVTSDINETKYDVATAKWGNPWRMMSWKEVEEMDTKCSFETITQNGVKGMRITGPNGNSIFMPYNYSQAGFYETGVWTGTIMKSPYGAEANSVAYLAIFRNYAIDGPSISTSRPGERRYKGFYVRAVRKK